MPAVQPTPATLRPPEREGMADAMSGRIVIGSWIGAPRNQQVDLELGSPRSSLPHCVPGRWPLLFSSSALHGSVTVCSASTMRPVRSA